MKIIFSPSKEMDFSKKSISSLSSQIENSDRNFEIYEKLIQLSKEEISRKFKIKNDMLEEFLLDLNSYRISNEKPSVEAYSGIAFRKLLINDYTHDNFQYMYEHLRILSAFYGFTKGTDLIKKHRLDFSAKIFEEMSLYKFWEKYVNDEFCENEMVLNLASSEYSKLLNKKRLKIVDFEFYENEEFKQISTNSKKARGEMLNLLILNKITEIDEIKSLQMREYDYKYQYSTDEKLVFIKK